MSLSECIKNQGRTWKRVLLVSCILIVLLMVIAIGVTYSVFKSSAKDVQINISSREDIIAELMAKQQNLSTSNLAKFSNAAKSNRTLSVPHFNINQTEFDEFNATLVAIEEELEMEAESVEPNLHPLEIWQAPEEIQKAFRYYHAGYDKENRSVWILPFGTWHFRQYMDRDDADDEENLKFGEMYGYQFTHRVNQSRHRVPSSKNNGTGLTSWVFICDMEGYSYWEFASMKTIKFLMKMALIFAPMLDEMEYGFVLNLDWVSRLFANVIRPILGQSRQKMAKFGTDRDEYVEAILAKIPASQLPSQYGGVSEDFEPVASYG